MITEETTLRPLPLPLFRPVALAVHLYEKWNSSVPFADDLAHYTVHGLVISRTDIFAMAKLVEFRGEPAWFVRMAVGDLGRLLENIPVKTPWMMFCRRGKEKIRAYRLDRLIELSTRGAAI